MIPFKNRSYNDKVFPCISPLAYFCGKNRECTLWFPLFFFKLVSTSFYPPPNFENLSSRTANEIFRKNIFTYRALSLPQLQLLILNSKYYQY